MNFYISKILEIKLSSRFKKNGINELSAIKKEYNIIYRVYLCDVLLLYIQFSSNVSNYLKLN